MKLKATGEGEKEEEGEQRRRQNKKQHVLPFPGAFAKKEKPSFLWYLYNCRNLQPYILILIVE